jgi:hypothetical protein
MYKPAAYHQGTTHNEGRQGESANVALRRQSINSKCAAPVTASPFLFTLRHTSLR